MDFLPGLLQGISRVLISYPFDYIRVHRQKHNTYIYEIFKSGGLYRGIKYPLLTIPIDRAISYKFFEHFNKNYNSFIAAGITSFITSIYSTPLQYINTNYILKYSISQRNIFKGYLVEYTRLTASSIIYMGMYGELRKRKNSPVKNGVISSIVMWSIIYPLDSLRLEVQTTKNNIFQSFINLKSQGYNSFYRGIGLVYARSIPSAAVGMAVYEFTRSYLKTPVE